MRGLKSVLRGAAALGLLCATILALAGCGGGTGSSPSGRLFVSADPFVSSDAIYLVAVTENFPPFATRTYDYSTAPSFWIDPTETLFIDDLPPGNYAVEVEWTDGAIFPTFTDTHPFVDIFDGADTDEHFPS